MKQKEKPFFGEKLRRLRLERGLTQTQIGDRVGLSKRMIFHYEKHATRPPTDTVARLANALNVKIDELIKADNGNSKLTVDPRFTRRLEKTKRLPSGDQKILSGIIDSFLHKNGLTRKRKTKKNATD